MLFTPTLWCYGGWGLPFSLFSQYCTLASPNAREVGRKLVHWIHPATCPIATNGRWINTLFQLLAKGLCLPIIQKQQTSNQTTKPTHCFIFILFFCHQLQWGLAAYNNWDGPSFLLLFSTPCFGWTCGTSWVTFGHPNHESYHDHDYHQFLYMKISNHMVDSSAKNRSRMFAFTNNSIFFKLFVQETTTSLLTSIYIAWIVNFKCVCVCARALPCIQTICFFVFIMCVQHITLDTFIILKILIH